MVSKQFEKTYWFRGLASTLAIVSAFGLCALAGLWPFGAGSLAAGVIVFFCLVGLKRFYFGALGMLIVLVQSRRLTAGPRVR
jgi:hypothetical protein